MMTAAQMRAGRALVAWSQDQLASASGVATATVKRMEQLGPGRSSADNVEAVRKALNAGGVELIAAGDGRGEGVRLKQPSEKAS